MHRLSEQLVAIKALSKEHLKFQQDLKKMTQVEMGILKSCNHPHVVRLYDYFETPKNLCFVMELCSGGDLGTYLKKRMRLKEKFAKHFFKQIVEGLAYLHEEKLVIHRDLKLDNIMLDAIGNVKIGDFGVSRKLKHSN
jgi:serine/threonine protein kinase